MCGSWRVPSPPPSWGLGLGVLICGLGPPRVPASWSVRGHPAGLGTARGSVMRGSSHLGGQWTGGVSRDRPCVGGLPRGPLPQRPGVCCMRVLGLLQPLLASLSTHSGPPAPEQRGGWGARPSVASVSVCEVGGTAAPSLPQGSGGRMDEPGVHPTDRCGCPPSSAHP